MVEKYQYDDLMSEYLKLADAMKVIKKELSTLQDLVCMCLYVCVYAGVILELSAREKFCDN